MKPSVKKAVRSSIFKKMTRKGNNITIVYTAWEEDHPFMLPFELKIEVFFKNGDTSPWFEFKTGGNNRREAFKNMRSLLAKYRQTLSYLPTKE